jgi:hypothetical protein
MVQFQRAADCWLSSLGLTLLILSVVLVPTSGALGDDGGGGPLAVTCKSSNGCNAGGCKQDPITGGCPLQGTDRVNCSWGQQGCGGCTCLGCYFPDQRICGCQCQSRNFGCATYNTCNTNNEP